MTRTYSHKWNIGRKWFNKSRKVRKNSQNETF